ncbi:hypothetical protein MMC07_002761 [Pseudocyphellaria aurata]|nr:hypothetical protein [Pseudocyphellaria aurata]
MDLQDISSVFFHPLVFYLVQNLLLTLVIGFTSPTAILRSAIVPPLIACAARVIVDAPTRTRHLWAVLWCGAFVGNLIHYIESALIVKWSFETRGPTASTKPQISAGKYDNHSNGAITTQTRGGTFWERFKFGSFVLRSTRYIGTPYMVKGVPNYSSDPHYIPSRKVFFFRNAFFSILALLSMELQTIFVKPVEYNEVAYSPEAVPLFRGNRENRSLEQLIFRSTTILGFWFGAYVFLNGLMSCGDFFAVALGIDDVRTSRPNFDSISEAYSIRQFWGSVWHQQLRKPLSAFSDVIVFKILRLRKGALVTRYLHLSLVFFFSGVLHEVLHVAQAVPRPYGVELHFYMTQAVGIMLEDIVQAMYRSIRGIQRGTPPTPTTRLVGYIWLALFLSWSSPVWVYIRLRTATTDPSQQLLPFSLLSLWNRARYAL